MNIGIDLDEVLADFLSALLVYHNADYGTSIGREQFRSYRFWETWGGSREEAIQKVYAFHKTLYFRNIEPVKDSQKSVAKLRENNNLFVVTSRQDDVAQETLSWIAEHFPSAFSAVYFTNHYSQNGSPRSKKQICKSIGVDVLIEDSLEYALECVQQDRKVLLLDCPWNKRQNLPEGISRVHSWREIVDVIS